MKKELLRKTMPPASFNMFCLVVLPFLVLLLSPAASAQDSVLEEECVLDADTGRLAQHLASRVFGLVT